MAHLLRCYTKINAQRIKDTPALYFCSRLVSVPSIFKRLTESYIRVCPDAFAFLLCEILFKISHIFSNKRVNASGRVDKKRGKIDTMRPFETRSGSTLVE